MEIEKITPDFEARFESYADGNHTLLQLEINSPEIHEWVKNTALAFYAFGRGDQAAADAATVMGQFPNGL